jgi:hypothetical protein
VFGSNNPSPQADSNATFLQSSAMLHQPETAQMPQNRSRELRRRRHSSQKPSGRRSYLNVPTAGNPWNAASSGLKVDSPRATTSGDQVAQKGSRRANHPLDNSHSLPQVLERIPLRRRIPLVQVETIRFLTLPSTPVLTPKSADRQVFEVE